MANIITSALQGNTVIFTLETYNEDELRMDADTAPTISIKKGEAMFVSDLISAAMTRSDLGEYKYYWDTDDVVIGMYSIDAVFAVDGVKQHIEIQRTITD